jgi:hypothetical protein
MAYALVFQTKYIGSIPIALSIKTIGDIKMTHPDKTREALKPCPFCNRKPEKVNVEGELFTVCCQPCGIFKGTVEEWNTRAATTPAPQPCGAYAGDKNKGSCGEGLQPRYNLDELLEGVTPENAGMVDEQPCDCAGLEEVLLGCVGILDIVKSEWGDGWTEYDQSIRDGLTQQLLRFNPEVTIAPPSLKTLLVRFKIARKNAVECGRCENVTGFNKACSDGYIVQRDIEKIYGYKTIKEAREALAAHAKKKERGE